MCCFLAHGVGAVGSLEEISLPTESKFLITVANIEYSVK